MTALKESEGWDELSKADRKAAKKEVFAKYKPEEG